MSSLKWVENKKITIFFNETPFEIFEETAKRLRIKEGQSIQSWVDYHFLIKNDSVIGLQLMKQQFNMPLYHNFHLPKPEKKPNEAPEI